MTNADRWAFLFAVAVLLVTMGIITQLGTDSIAQRDRLEADRDRLAEMLRACQRASQEHVRQEQQMNLRQHQDQEMIDSLLGAAEDCFSTCGERDGR